MNNATGFWAKLKVFFKNPLLQLRRFRKAHPWKLGLLSLLGALILANGFVSYYDFKQQRIAQKHIESLTPLSLQALYELGKEGKIKEVITHDIRSSGITQSKEKSYLEIKTTDNRLFAWEKTQSSFLQDEVGKMMFENSISRPIMFKTGHVLGTNPLSEALSLSFLVVLVLTVLSFAQNLMAQTSGGVSFKPQKPDTTTTLDDIIGYHGVKRQLTELKDQLHHPERYEKRGVLPPKGILFSGDPGVGKTMLAKAFANELGADLFTCTGADFAEMYVGVGAKKARSLFRQARQSALSVIFIDEIDALGSRQSMGNDTERLSVINTILSEMDGMNVNKRMVVIGATNLPHLLDPALKRPGRFDHTVYIPLPDAKTREGILERYLKEVPTKDIDLKGLALRTQGYSGAQLRNIVLEAKRLAVRENGLDQDWFITQELLHKAQEIALLGVGEVQPNGKDLVRVAVHELGHALTSYLLCPDFLVEKVTVNGRGQALGYAVSRPIEERMLVTKEQMKARLVHYMAGRAAEEVVLGDVSGGAADDIKKSNDMARGMVLHYGMGEKTGFSQPINDQGGFELTSETKEDIQSILDEAYRRAKDIITIHKDWLKNKTSLLMEQGQLSHKQLFSDLQTPLQEESEEEKWFNTVLQKVKRQEKPSTPLNLVLPSPLEKNSEVEQKG